jgi:pimeloyl-ACP methyl ester carboxylesterase
MDTIRSTENVRYLSRPGGRIAYTVDGSGPLVVLVPGMGDVRATWRDLVGPLVEQGHRVAAMDLRGHGDSDTTFTEHGDVVTGRDVLALVEELDAGPAVLAGNSMGGSSVAWAAAERPDLVAGLVLVAPLLREPPTGRFARAAMHGLMRVMFARPWGARVWAVYYRGALNKGTRSPWLAEHVDALHRSLREPGRLRSFRTLTVQLDHRVVEPRLADVVAPAIAFVGDRDPDFRDPRAELDWIADTIGATPVWLTDVGHYPQHQRPDVIVPETLGFLAGLPRTGAAWSAPGAAGA